MLSSSPFSFSFSLCKGRTLYSVVRDAKIVLDVNKTRQIAQEIVKVWCGVVWCDVGQLGMNGDPDPAKTWIEESKEPGQGNPFWP